MINRSVVHCDDQFTIRSYTITMAEITATAQDFYKLDVASPDSISRKFDVFSVPFTHTHTTGGVWERVSAKRMTSDGPLEFTIPSSTNLYTDLSDSYVEVRCKITLANGDALPPNVGDILVAPGDNFFHSLFSSASVRFNDTVVEYEGNYPWRAYLDKLLHTSADHKRELMLATDGWSEDDSVAKNFDGMTADDLAARRRRIVGSKTMAFSGRLALSVMNGMGGRHLIPRVEVDILLNRAPVNIALMAEAANPAGGAKIEITHASMYVRRVVANSAAQVKLEKSWLVSPATYGFNRVKTSFKSISQGVTSADFQVQERGQIPNRLYVGLIHHAAQSGNYTRNAYRADHFNLSAIGLKVSGFPRDEMLEMDYTNGNVTRAYQNMRKNVGGVDEDVLNGLTLEDFQAGGVSWYCFDLSADRCADSDGGIHLVKYGSVNVDLRFAAATNTPISAFIMMEKDDLITINHNLGVESRTGIS